MSTGPLISVQVLKLLLDRTRRDLEIHWELEVFNCLTANRFDCQELLFLLYMVHEVEEAKDTRSVASQ